MTTLALLEHLGMGSLDWANYAYMLGMTAGLDDLPPLRGQDQPWAGLPGRYPANAVYDSRSFDAGIYVMPMDAAGNTSGTPQQQARANLDALKAMFALSQTTLQSVARVMPDGSTRIALGKVISAPVVDFSETGEIYYVTPKIWLPDPFFYAGSVTAAPEVFSSSPHAWTVNNPGDVPGYNLQFDILGPATHVRITNVTNGSYFDITGTVAGTKHLMVDCLAFTAVNDGTSVIGNLSHLGSVPFLLLNPGDNLLQATATGLSGATRITTTFTAPYL